jgi:hypothetical protein
VVWGLALVVNKMQKNPFKMPRRTLFLLAVANWDAILHHRASHRPDWDPLTQPKNLGLNSSYTPDL